MFRAGGTVTSILREAFQAWDQDSSGELNTKEFVGAIGRCGLQIDDATAHQLVNYYDRKGEQGRFGDGEIHYMDLVEELGKTRVPRRPTMHRLSWRRSQRDAPRSRDTAAGASTSWRRRRRTSSTSVTRRRM